ncbi:MAG: CHAD domain-containing protein, partial [Burkholderiales bacterium]
MQPSADLLVLPARESARRIALAQLKVLVKARDKLNRDSESLHQFRVSIRRLRSLLRAYKGELEDSVKKKSRRELRTLTQSTNESRDAEVQLAWLRAQMPGLNRTQLAGVTLLIDRIEKAKCKADKLLYRTVDTKFEDVRRRLAGSLSSPFPAKESNANAASKRTAANAFARQVTRLAFSLERNMALVRFPSSLNEAHQARIACKRLRYLIEPFTNGVGECRTCVNTLKTLQDLLGDLHDAQLLEKEVSSFLKKPEDQRAHSPRDTKRAGKSDPGAPRRAARYDPRAGLAEIVSRLRVRREATHTKMISAWEKGIYAPLLRDIPKLAGKL